MYFHIGFGGFSGFEGFTSGFVTSADAAGAVVCSRHEHKGIKASQDKLTSGPPPGGLDSAIVLQSPLLRFLISWVGSVTQGFRQD
jgi:hypothetical protein